MNTKSLVAALRQNLRLAVKYLLGALLVLFALAPPASAHFLFVTTRLSDAVAVIDSVTDEVTATIPVAGQPVRICTTPDRLKAYVSNQISGTVSVLDTTSLKATGTIDVGTLPQESAVTPDGKKLFLVHQSGPYVTVVDTSTDCVIQKVLIGGDWAKDVLFRLDGRFAYVANFSEGGVNVIDTKSYRQKLIPTGAGARRLAISPAGDRVFVTNYYGNSVSSINTLRQSLVATVSVGSGPRGIAVSPDGDKLYVGNVLDGTVSIIDSKTFTVSKTLTVGATPLQVVVTSDGATVFVSNADSSTVSVIDTATQTVTKTLNAGAGAFFSTFDPDGNRLYVSNCRSNSVTVIDVSSQSVLQTIPGLPPYPFDLVFGP